jgi:hypothetical protein
VWAEFSPTVSEFIARLEAKKSTNHGEQDQSGFGRFRSEDDDELQLDLSNTKVNPYTLWKMLERMGYQKTKFDSNGWEFDFWITFTKAGYKPLLVWGTGITFNLWLTEAESR